MLGRRISLTYTPPPVRKRLVLCGLTLRPMYRVELSAIQSYLPARLRTFAVITHMTLSSSELPLNPPFSKGEAMKIRTREKNSRFANSAYPFPPLKKHALSAVEGKG